MKQFKNDEVILAKKVEVTITECNGDFNKMLKKFSRKVKREEILKPFYGRVAFHTTKGQKRREKRNKGVYLSRRKAEKDLEKE